ncbi:SusC/RagA family TonB-linked outer membrane protein [Mucilaginibacter aquariorum]|uniref:SusC/RagA family TonB-linked outer membrane protein n=1 Tax=Mucilaginibacter aquariorum TaxID=2967225 RepID=A0ABT1SXZ7_9SPHI|nr:SusC/RagA family TonB-linked outer membrane protein [Mucilaginibacter aquariorum]MCQ6957225.1 SusC/RagA family TonB-linked outer membrane protein [Mucilaginibacter aquariorum]
MFKFILILVIVSSMQAFSKGYGQTKINVSFEKVPLKKALREIEKKSDYHFLYNDDVLAKNNLPASLNTKDASLDEVMNALLHKTNLGYTLSDNNLVILSEKGSILSAVTVTGIVTDETNQPLAGVSIKVKKSELGTQTDVNGKYALNIPDANANNVVLVFSYVGFNQQELPLNGSTVVNVKLLPASSSLNEVIVVGYGGVKKKDITGSVGIVDAKEAKKLSTNDMSQLLQGRVAGVVVNSDGQPGAFPSVRIRGFNTFGDSAPLYVIDGVAMSNSPRDFNPNDIESMQVLKDASAAAIYGSRAANGVVIITTKQGKKNTAFKIDYSAYYGVDKIWQRIPVLNRVQYQTVINEVNTNAGLPLIPGNDPASSVFVSNTDTDWQKVGQKNGNRQNHDLNFSGGSEHFTYNVSLDYFGNKGTFVGNGPTYDRYSTRVNTTGEKGIFRFGESVVYTHSHENALTYRSDILTGNRPPLIIDLIEAVPTQQLYDPTKVGGFGGILSTVQNVISLNAVGINSLIKNYTDVDRIFASAFGEIDLLKYKGHSLRFKTSLGYDKVLANDFSYQPPFDLGYFFNQAISRLDNTERLYTTAQIENTITYNKRFGKHAVDVLLGQSYQQNNFQNLYGHSENVIAPYLTLSNGTNKTTDGTKSESTLSSYFGRVNYNFDDRYLLTATLRRDGSSRFAPDHRYGYFPSAALAWRISSEEFFAPLKNIVSDLKFRGGYGKLGNQNIGDYLYTSYINSNIVYNFNNTKVTGGLVTNLVSENIKWESRSTTNLGFDATLLNGAVDLSAEYYNSKTADVLVGVPIPSSTGSVNQAPVVNAATLRNRGVEVTVAYHKRTGEFTWDVAANIATVRNKVLALGGNNEPIYGVGSKTEVGGEIGEHYGYVAEGIFQNQAEIDAHARQEAGTAPGDIKFRDINGDGVVTPADRTYLGSAIPKLNYGLNLSAAYKRFDISVFTSGSSGFLINSRLYRDLMLTTDYINRSTDILNRWTPTNTNTDIPRVVQNDPNQNQRDSNRKGWLQNGKYLRINTVQLGYAFKKDLIKGVSNLRVYGTAQNLYSFQAYKGFNPDFTSGVFNPGFDAGSFPKPRTILMGVQVGF